MLCGYEILAFLQPFGMDCFHGTRFLFIRTHTVNAAHKNIAEYRAVSRAQKQVGIYVEAGIAFQSGKV